MSSLRPPDRSITTFLAHGAGALVGGIGGAVLLFLLASLAFAGAGLGMGLLTVQVYAVMLGFGLGTGAGVALAGRLLGQRGNIWLGIVAGALGGVLCVLLLAAYVTGILRIPGLRIDLLTLPIVAAIVSIVAAVVGYNVGARTTSAP